MGTDRKRIIQLVITVALKKEIPKDWLEVRGVPVLTLAALKSGALTLSSQTHTGIIAVITGVGLKASREAALWICDNISPLFVLNIGTCGITGKRHLTGNWYRPGHVTSEDGQKLELHTRLPVPHGQKIINVHSLLSVDKAFAGDIPEQWRKHDIIDMECYAQASVFSETDVSFHCLKFGTDYSDSERNSDFNKNLYLLREQFKKMFNFFPSPFSGEGRKEDHNIKVAVVVPVYNRENTIKSALDSILSQSYLPEEIIVVDDCSTDKTREILQSYENDITTVYLSKNSGPSKARNEGIQHVSKEWIAFLDSDDSWEQDKLKNQIEYLTRYPFYEIIQSEEKWIRKGRRVNPCKHHKKPEGWIFEPSLERCLISPSSVLIKRSLIEQYGCFYEGLPVCEDYDLWLKISRHHPVGLDRGRSVIKYGGHKDQLSQKYPAMDRFRVKSLTALLGNESNPSFRQIIIQVLQKKLKILINGCEKRGKEREAREYREILQSVQ